MPWSPQWSLWLFHQNPICIPLLMRDTCCIHLDFRILIILLKSMSYGAPHYAVFSNPL
jgi:hypothetical protein